MKRLLRLVVMLIAACTSLVWGARVVGHGSRDSLLAYGVNSRLQLHLYVFDWRRGIRTDLGLLGTDKFAWSTDGQLAYLASLGDKAELVVWNNGEVIPVTQDIPLINALVWSRDGRLAIMGAQRNMTAVVDIWDGATLTNISEKEYYDFFPNWSADGRLAFESPRTNENGIYVWDGSDLSKVSGDLRTLNGPDWNTDGQLAFTALLDGSPEIYVWDRANLTDISQHPATDVSPTWNKDGRLAFTSNRDGNSEIYVWDGVSLTNVTQNASDDFWPVWSKDKRLAFTSNRENGSALYVWDGTTSKKISPYIGSYNNLSWSDDGLLALAWANDVYVWDGSKVINVTRTPNADELYPAWWTPPQ